MSILKRHALAISMAVAALAAPAPARASVIEVFRELAQRNLRPAPLVPTSAPRSLSPLDRTIELSPTERRSAYAVRPANAFRQPTIDTVILLEGGEFPTTRAALRRFRSLGHRVRSMRVRGRRGHLLTEGRGGRVQRTLLWAEDGRVYTIATGTPRTVSLRELRATAADLDQLVGSFSGSSATGEQETFVVTTRRTVTAEVSWTAECTRNGFPASQRAGTASVTLQPRAGADFSYDIASNVAGPDPLPWQGTVSGSVTSSGGTVNLRATLSEAGDTCDTGPVSLTLRREG